jgi:UDP-N-acetylmuramoyl-tripeptide--D-alanyl-D-alanine ligase
MDLLFCSPGKLIGKLPEKFKSFKIDSREINKGDIFVALKGANFDGHDFINNAIKNGAIGFVVEKNIEIPEDLFKYIVTSTSDFLLSIGLYARRLNDANFIGITGSAGKTTTKEMVYLVLSEKYEVVKTPGNLNTELSLPIFLVDILGEKRDFVIAEMGIQRVGDMEKLVKIINPHLSVILNVGDSHIEFLGDRECVANEKFKIINNNTELAILNYDDVLIRTLSNNYCIGKFFFGTDDRADLSGRITFMNEVSMEISLNYKGKLYSSKYNFSGTSFFYDILAAISVGINFNVNIIEALNLIKRFIPLKGRGEVIELPWGIKIIDETYNSNPFSLKQAIARVKNHEEYLIVIVGDMLELGEASPQLHRQSGGIIASVKPNKVIAFGKYSKFVLEGLNENGLRDVFGFEDRKMAIDFLNSIAIPEKSIIFIKGSRGINMEDFIEIVKKRL